MSKKFQIDIQDLKQIGLSNNLIREIVKKAEPNHWTNKLPQDVFSSYSFQNVIITPDIQKSGQITIILEDYIDPTTSFFNKEDAEFMLEKCNLMIEMSNYAYSVNENWFPNFNDKDQKKYGIVFQKGIPQIKENEFFNIFVFGIALKNKILAYEMLQEFGGRISKYFNFPLNFKNKKAVAPVYSFSNLESKRFKVKDIDKSTIKDMLEEGISQKIIAEKLGCSPSNVVRLKKEFGFVSRKYNKLKKE